MLEERARQATAVVANIDFSLQCFLMVAFADDEEHDIQPMSQSLGGIEHGTQLKRALEIAGIADDEVIPRMPVPR